MTRAIRAAVLLTLIVGLAMPAGAQEARRRWELMRQIRLDKFDLVLPQAMRDHGIDMWIVAMREDLYDPLYEDLGRGYPGRLAYYVFTDRGGERIERAALGLSGYLLAQSGAYDIITGSTDLAAFVRERDPTRVGVNMSDDIGAADGLSYTLHRHLVQTLGEPYAGRLVSAERLVADFRTRRVASEIVAFGEAARLTVELAERAFSNEVITPGRTSLEDVAWWLQDRLLERGLTSVFDMPSVYVTGPDGIQAVSDRTVVQPGMMLMIDWGVSLMNFATDIKRIAYVLKPGEYAVPASFQQAFDHALEVQRVMRRHIQVGRTGQETLDHLHAQLEGAGFSIIEFNRPKEGPSIDVVIGCHPVGNTGHGQGPSITTWQPLQSTFTLVPTHMFSFEFFTYTPIPEWGGRKLRIPLEDNALLTEQGVEWLHAPNRRILLIGQ